MRKLMMSLIISAFLLPTSVRADDDEREDERCKEGRCCVGIIAFCDNEFPLLPPKGGDAVG